MSFQHRMQSLGPWDRLFEIRPGLYTIPRELWRYKHNQISYQHYLTRTLFPLLDTLIGDRVGTLSALDLGCNCGWLSILLRRYGFREVLGIDMNEDYIAQAKFLAEATATEGVRFESTPLKKIQGEFDMIFMFGVLNHTHSPVEYFAKVYDLARKFFVLDYNDFTRQRSREIQRLAAECLDGREVGSIHTRFKEGVTGNGKNRYYFVYEFSEEAVVQHLQHAGFFNILKLCSPVAMPHGYRKRENNCFLMAEKHANPNHFEEEMALDACYASKDPATFVESVDFLDPTVHYPSSVAGFYAPVVKTSFLPPAYQRHVYSCFAARHPKAPVYAWGAGDAYTAFRDCLKQLTVKAIVSSNPHAQKNDLDGIPVVPPEALATLPNLPLLILVADKPEIFRRVRAEFPHLDCIP